MENSEVIITPSRRRARSTQVLGFFLLFGLGIFVGRYVVPQAEFAGPAIRYVEEGSEQRELVFPTFWEAWDHLHQNFIGELNEQDLLYGAVSGMISAAGDPYTAFADPETTQQFEQTINGSFSGVGIEIGVRQGLITVIAPLDGSPAQQAGVREGDIIAAVDGENLTAETTLDEVVSRIRGHRGTDVTLTVIHPGANETSDITITRDTIEIESVKVNIENGIAHIAITSFNSDTPQRFTTAARQVIEAGAQGIILDLRNNPGGFLQAAVDIASRFLPKGTIVVSEQGKQNNDYRAEGNTILEGVPVVVLVNGGSASASEILAGALHDQADAPIIGTQTFGKGSVQEFIKLGDGSSLRVTIARWFTPGGRNINEEGIAPTIEVEQDHETEVDEPLDRARQELQQKIEQTTV